MPHRIAAAVQPLARLHAREMADAFEALCAHACEMTGISSALVAQGMSPGAAHMLARQWHAAGLTIHPEVRAAALMPGVMGVPGMMGMPAVMGMPAMMGMPVGAFGISPWAAGITAAPWLGVPGLAGITAGAVPRLGLAGLLLDPD
ncbi:hypothetical protein [Caldinitratiruptor microaerophilus]|uniref:Uncharacterized protein n=1 Tax=Caldinitratiruptor microaerophilus TaxID=671077 RepID=A0AA35GA84_9FIRM|nr:hypothetical protein [Caldinitratiruptor microaerophilus]BDG61024.1 hypothetical protein caldi_21140 [Caldinitratiruptor microaerophilus]